MKFLLKLLQYMAFPATHDCLLPEHSPSSLTVPCMLPEPRRCLSSREHSGAHTGQLLPSMYAPLHALILHILNLRSYPNLKRNLFSRTQRRTSRASSHAYRSVLVRWSRESQDFKVILGYSTRSGITWMNLHEAFFKKLTHKRGVQELQ